MIFFLIASLLIPGALGAAPLDSYIPAEAIRTIMDDGEIRNTVSAKEIGKLLEIRHEKAIAMKDALLAEKPGIIIEAAFLWTKPGGPGTQDEIPQDELLALYNIMRSIGSLEGIEYYSASRKTMRLFYESSSLVSAPDGKTSLPDTRLHTLPSGETLYARQKDLSFGDNVYRIELLSGADFVHFSSINTGAVSYGIIPLAGKEKIKIQVLLINADEGVLIYTLSSVNAVLLPGMRGKLEDSFGNRAAAVFAWFKQMTRSIWP